MDMRRLKLQYSKYSYRFLQETPNARPFYVLHYFRLLQHPWSSFDLLQYNTQNIEVQALIYYNNIRILCR